MPSSFFSLNDERQRCKREHSFEWVIQCFCPSVPTGHSPFTFSFCYLLCSVCRSTPTPHFSLSVCLRSFPASVPAATTRAKLVLGTSAGILTLRHGNVLRKDSQHFSLSSVAPKIGQSVPKALSRLPWFATVNAWHVTATKIGLENDTLLCQRGLKREKDAWVCKCVLRTLAVKIRLLTRSRPDKQNKSQ